VAAGSRSAQLAKLSRPRLFEALPRERLFALLDKVGERPVLWVAAPPGAGKTTLIASYLESRKLTGIWYQVDAGDADPATFFYYLGLAESSISGHHRDRATLPLLTPEYLQDIAGFARRFFRELFLRLGASATLVFDNFQEVPDEASLHEAILAALEEVPSGTRVFVISRTEPSARYARLGANRALMLVGWEQLKLTTDEALSILQSTGIALDASTCRGLLERAGGWAAGLVLLVERLRRGGSIESFTEPDSLQQVFAYFAGQLFDKASKENQLTLLRLSYLPNVSERMAEQLTGEINSRRLLEQLYRRHLFTDRRRGDQNTYQFHALFRAFLQHRAETDLNPAQQRDMLRRAGQLLEAGDQPEEAMPLYIKAADFPSAQTLILDKSASLIGQGRWKVVVDWVESLPEERINQSPWLLHWLGTAQIGVNPERARSILERAYAGAVKAEDVMCQVQVAAGMVEAIFLEYTVFSPLDRWIPVLELLLQPGFAFPSLESELRAQSALLIASTYRMPEHPQIDRCVGRVRELLRTGVDINLRVSAATHLTLYGSFTGHLMESRRAATLLAPLLADPAVHVFRRVFAWAVITWYASNTSDYVLGDQAVLANEAIARDEGIHVAERFACIIGYFLDMDRRDSRAGVARIERFEQIMIPSQPYEAASLVNMKAWHGVYTGDHALTLKHGPRAFELYSEAGSIPHILQCLNGLIWGCVEGAEEDTARFWITEHRRWSSRRNMEWARWGPDAADAILAMGHSEDAILEDSLRRIFADERHRLDQYGHTLVWCRSWASVLSGEALLRGIQPERVARFIVEFKLDAPSPQFEAWPWELRLLTLGKFAVVREGAPLTFNGKVPKKLLALLKSITAFGGVDVPEEKITDALWADQDGDVAHQSFTMALHRLRKLLGDHELIIQREGKLSINTRRVWVDAFAFEEIFKRVQDVHRNRDAATYPALALRAIALYRGAFLEDDMNFAWSLNTRTKMRGLFIGLVSGLGEHFEQQKKYEDALAVHRRGIEIDALVETFYLGAMRCLQMSGRTAEALDVYRRMKEVFATSLGVNPSATTEALFRSLSQVPPPT
jgi:DNA-binding SARP family transcriptional activator